MKNRHLIVRLRHAYHGWCSAWRGEKSLRAQGGFALLALLLLIILQPALVWWALIGIMIALVLAVELLNTALEHLADHLHPELHPRIKLVKDCAAAAVLVLSLGALWIGLLMVLSVLTR